MDPSQKLPDDTSDPQSQASAPQPAAPAPPASAFGPEYYDFLAPADGPGALGRLGPYRVLSIVGAGGMGVVYEVLDIKLERRVALKAMLPALAASPTARQRFLREAKAAASIEHERIVPIFHVDEDRGVPFLVMPLLKGETLENRLNRVGKLSVAQTVRIGGEIAEALTAAHGRGLIHRDIKPANVWLEGPRASVKLLDFGLARAVESTEAPLSMSGSIYGTAGYVSPEQAQGEKVDHRADLFALGCVLYRMCAGTLPFPGRSALAVLIAVVNGTPSPLVEIAPEVPAALSQLIAQLLAKRPGDRPQSAQVVMDMLGGIPVPLEPPGSETPPPQEKRPPDAGPMLSATARALGASSPSPAPPPNSDVTSLTPKLSGFGLGQNETLPPGAAAPTPPPNAPPPNTPPLDSDVMLSATARTPKLSGFAFAQDQAPPPVSPDIGTPTTRIPPARETAKITEVPDTPPPQGRDEGRGKRDENNPSSPHPSSLIPHPLGRTGSRRILLGALGTAALIGLAAVLLIRFWPAGPAPIVEITIAYGSEKENWFKEAAADFAAAPAGQGIKIKLFRVGSVRASQVLAKGEEERVHAWSPAHAIYRAKFVQEWQARHPGQNPILKEESLCMTPMVFVFWKERHDAFLTKYKTVSFTTLSAAMNAKNGWGDIAGKPEWGRFRFGMTQPDTSNSGLMGVALLACELNKSLTLTPADLTNPDLRARIASFKQGLAENAKSTDKLMKEMVGKGPTGFDAVLLYENLAIDYLRAAQGRWGELHVAYPRSNIFNDNPYYILDAPWSSPEQRSAAEAFLHFLLSADMQQKALSHGFRPANISVPIREGANSPFVRYAGSGLTVSIDSKCDVGQAAVLDGLLGAWDTVP